MKSLVLDVDGVLIRDKLLLSHVKENCVNYVRHKMPECKDPVWANKTMYLTHGHTGRGLQETFRKDVSDFNSFVYDKSLLSHLSEVIYSPEFQEDAKEIHDWTTRGWRVTLFTNSPIEWAGPVARAISSDVFLRCSNSDINFLKPDHILYNSFSKKHRHLYVDDSLKNLAPVRFLENWDPVYFHEGGSDQSTYPQIGSLWELSLMLDYASKKL